MKHIILTVTLLGLLLSEALGQVSFPAGADRPHGIAFTPDGNYMFVACSSGKVTKIRMSDYSVVGALEVGGNPLRIAMTPDGQYVFVSNTVQEHYITKIDCETLTKTCDFLGYGYPVFIKFSADGEKAYITSFYGPYVQVVSVSACAQLAAIPGINPGGYDIELTQGGDSALVLAQTAAVPYGDGLYVVSLKDQAVIDKIDVSGHSLACRSDGDEVWVAGFNKAPYIFIVSLKARSKVDSIYVGGTPWMIEFSPDERYAYVTGASDGVNAVHILSISDRTCVFTINDLNVPTGIGISPDGRAFVANNGGNTITEVTASLFHTKIVNFDIKPGSCPNPLNVKAPKRPNSVDDGDELGTNGITAGKQAPQVWRSSSVFPTAILGTADFDVSDIDPTTITIEGVTPVRWSICDVATPVAPGSDECACSDSGPDGYPDLTVKFYKSQIIEVLGQVYEGDQIALTLSGELKDGTPFTGTDCVVIVNGEDPEDGLLEGSAQASLIGNYPNPFNPVTEIDFNLSTVCRVKLEVFNTLGQRVATLVDGTKEAGYHIVTWDASNVASGVYFYRLQAGDFVGTRKMILLK